MTIAAIIRKLGPAPVLFVALILLHHWQAKKGGKSRLSANKLHATKPTVPSSSSTCATANYILDKKSTRGGKIKKRNNHIDDSDRVPSTIPHIIHQVCKSRCLSSDLSKIATTWRDLDSSFDYYFYDEHAVDQLLASPTATFPQIPQLVGCLSWPQKHRLFMYRLLWEQGGIFVDLNQLPVGWKAFSTTDAIMVYDTTLSQSFMAFPPHHPFIYTALQRAIAYVLLDRHNTQRGLFDSHFIRDVFADYCYKPGMRRQKIKPKPGKYMSVGGRRLNVVQYDTLLRSANMTTLVEAELALGLLAGKPCLDYILGEQQVTAS